MSWLPFTLVFATLVVAALVAVEAKRPGLLAVSKPLATLSLLPVVGLPPTSDLATLMCVGFMLAAFGDWALLKDDRSRFLMGLVFFLGAHILFTAAFVPVSAFATRSLPGIAVPAAVFAGAATLLIARMWAALGSMRLPVVVYGVVIAAMATVATSTLLGLLPASAAALAAVGATLFFASDALLAWRRFRRPFAHAQTITLVLYWSGELALALAARGT